ncbi:LuxR family two component transcriptional regulator [Stackebrandtia endophytica]|uniref:LuxR family two component transcriptional regulator n=1 Tax=Stackebrandtia endophytica TaxID=1496996 RepID=A0A543AXZ9_9ACTN|nr:response regulator transcription factor [Stackebrandtia endophytica]TQL77447.1 LuxR family two component transcriptional regulator [Stackebrandtia endophytica]
MRITIAEDSTLLREGIAQLLTAEGHTIVDAVGTADDLRRVVAVDPPDLVIVDVRMPPDYVDEGIHAALQIRAERGEIAVLVLSQYVERRHTGKLLDGRGGVGYLLKDRISDIAGFLDAIERVSAGGTAFDPEVIRQLISAKNAPDTRLGHLTERELEVLSLIAQGHSNTSVAGQLFISQSAVEKHVNAIFTKLRLPAGTSYNRRVIAVLKYLDER